MGIKKYRCNNCGYIFIFPFEVEERRGLDRPPYEKIKVCPSCRVADFEEREESEE